MSRNWTHPALATIALLTACVLVGACAESGRENDQAAAAETSATAAGAEGSTAGAIATDAGSVPDVDEAPARESGVEIGADVEGEEAPPVIATPIPTDKPRGRLAPEFNLTLLDGRSIKLEDMAGQVVLIDFWATWCGPCRMSIPHLMELQNEYGERGFTVLGVSLDRQGPGIVREYVDKNGINYPIAMGTPGMVRAYGGPAGIRSIPTAFLVDREGYVSQVIVGYRPKPELQKLIEPLLGS